MLSRFKLESKNGFRFWFGKVLKRYKISFIQLKEKKEIKSLINKEIVNLKSWKNEFKVVKFSKLFTCIRKYWISELIVIDS